MALLNPIFADPGPVAGEAAHWTIVAVTQRERIAAFGVPLSGVEHFEWASFLTDLTDVTVVVAIFDIEAVEDFAEGWDTAPFLLELPPAQQAPAVFDSADFESMETGWKNTGFAYAWSELSAAPAFFDWEPSETFDDRWQGNHQFMWDWSEVDGESGITEHFNGDTWEISNRL